MYLAEKCIPTLAPPLFTKNIIDLIANSASHTLRSFLCADWKFSLRHLVSLSLPLRAHTVPMIQKYIPCLDREGPLRQPSCDTFDSHAGSRVSVRRECNESAFHLCR